MTIVSLHLQPINNLDFDMGKNYSPALVFASIADGHCLGCSMTKFKKNKRKLKVKRQAIGIFRVDHDATGCPRWF